MIQTLDRQTNIALTLTTNGRLDIMDRTLPNLYEKVILEWDFDLLVIIDDSGQVDSNKYIQDKTPGFVKIFNNKNLGLANSVNNAWAFIPNYIDYVFHTEDDFLFKMVPPISDMISIMENHRTLSQLILKRNPVSYEENVAGGYIEMNPSKYHQHTDPFPYVIHKEFFSLNPGLIPKRIIKDGWPESNEAGMIKIMRERDLWSGILGWKNAAPVIEHIGYYRPKWWKA